VLVLSNRRQQRKLRTVGRAYIVPSEAVKRESQIL
jgi:hypothetical protein